MIKKIIHLLFLLFFIQSVAMAEALYSFAIQSSYLSNGKVNIYSTGITTIKFDVTFVRFVYNNVPENCNINFNLWTLGSSTPVAISPIFSVTTADFSSNSSDANWLYVNKTYSVDINSSAVYNGGQIALAWVSNAYPGSLPPGLTFSSSTNSYQILFVSTPPPPPPPPTYSCTHVTNLTSGIPSGTTKDGYINVGYGSSSPIVTTINPTATTTLLAVENIIINYEFNAHVTTGIFSAKTITCAQLPTARPISANNITTDNNKLLDNNIRVYPSPTNGIINISGSSFDLINSKIIINDQSGRIVNEFNNNSKINNMQLDLHLLSNGMYYVKIYMQNKIVTKKIVISK